MGESQTRVVTFRVLLHEYETLKQQLKQSGLPNMQALVRSLVLKGLNLDESKK